ncbi:Mannitol 2-dehydrogenase [Sulfitobacter sp. THAF37]|uniref:mannitol dehydrogenase family protein n=1 Tax=Sulfitobacter sp. THAF37 TaxID=2587855 RepID=UPI0012686441|nr:mannitol dehydrogenase family protein [Sulfitobacter sp. THAF37]QFT59364.1 Mannitol 2-dehydrogenase [Sulfitobacter sp. THAF37]
MKLSNATLAQLPEGIERPAYDRAALTPGILHIGVGNFHRAHQAWYLHRLMQEGVALDWAIVGAGVRPYDEAMRLRLAEQDYLTTLIELSPDGLSAEVVGPMIDYVPIAEGHGPLIARMAQADIRIVALTVTEGGYYIDPVTKAFDASHPDIVHDAAHPDSPRTAFGAMVAALRRRRDAATGPFTAQSCDNLQGNGDVLRQTVVGLARLQDTDLAEWIDAQCSFPNSMVDSIVPATGPVQIAQARALGVDDAAPVCHENFRQWVMEDDFCAGRPDWARAGAVFSDDVHGYETMKIRILNAGHQVIANAGEVLSLPTIAACMADPDVGALFRRVAMTEIVPHVKPVPGMPPEAYVELIDERFSNPRIEDTTRRVAFDGSARHTGFVLPLVRKALAAGLPLDGLALVEACWARMCEGTREDGSTIEPNDPMWDRLTATAQEARTRPAAWLEMTGIYGDLAGQAAFATRFEHWLQLIWQQGTRAALQSYNGAA